MTSIPPPFAVETTGPVHAPAWKLWWDYLKLPLLTFVAFATLFAVTDLDRIIAHAVFFDVSRGGWVGRGHWWINALVHEGGGWFVRAIALVGLLVWSASFGIAKLEVLRRPAAFLTLALALSVGTIGLLKLLTGVQCPWSLVDFGGTALYMKPFLVHPAALHPGDCFPAAHAATGYSLAAFYFVFRNRNESLAKVGFAMGMVGGLVLGLAQQSRGAHFASHDLWSAFLVWTVMTSLYAFAFRARLWQD